MGPRVSEGRETAGWSRRTLQCCSQWKGDKRNFWVTAQSPPELSPPSSEPCAPFGCSICDCQGSLESWVTEHRPAHLSTGGQPQQSLHLTALVQLVKEIPEFLFGEVKGTEDYPESGSTSLDGERASPEGKSHKLQSDLSTVHGAVRSSFRLGS